jgi:uncharacterized protein (DUF1800 family)
MATRQEISHLLRRATFGPRAAEVDDAVTRSSTTPGTGAGIGSIVDAFLRPSTVDAGATGTPEPALGPDPAVALTAGADRNDRLAAQRARRDQVRTITEWWLDRLVAADHQWTEKLIFFWHGHWATSVTKVKVAAYLLGQQHTFRGLGHGDFGALLKAMLRDPALVFWLDGQQNTKTAPNENLARESMELFTLGVGNYTEDDVRQAARALTGWQLDRPHGTLSFKPKRHDDGTKTILGQTGDFDTDGYADLLLAQAAGPRFLAARLWYRFASADPLPAATRERMVAAYGANRNITAMARALFTDPGFAATAGALVKQPVEWAAGAMRQLGIRPARLPDKTRAQVLRDIDSLGQQLFAPPSVGGWPAGAAWLTTDATALRVRLATVLVNQADPTALQPVSGASTKDRVDALARLLVVDAFTERTRAVLEPAAKDVKRLVTLGLASPEYAVC